MNDLGAGRNPPAGPGASAVIVSVEFLTCGSHSSPAGEEGNVIVYAAKSGTWSLSLGGTIVDSSRPEALNQPLLLQPGEFVVLFDRQPHQIQLLSASSSAGSESIDPEAVCLRGIVKIDPMQGRNLSTSSAWMRDSFNPSQKGGVAPPATLDQKTAPTQQSVLAQEFVMSIRKQILEIPAFESVLPMMRITPGIQQTLTAIDADPGLSWTLKRMAEVAGISRSSFAQKFKEQIGTTPRDHLLNVRMRRAEMLMKDGRQQLKMIARLIGYRSVSAFSTAYKRWAGKTPRQHRKLLNRESGSSGSS